MFSAGDVMGVKRKEKSGRALKCSDTINFIIKIQNIL